MASARRPARAALLLGAALLSTSAEAWAEPGPTVSPRSAASSPARRAASAPHVEPDAAAARDAFLDDQDVAMRTLAGWSAASVATGALLWATAGDDYERAVGVQNVVWGAIDGAIAAFALRALHGQRGAPGSEAHWAAERQKLKMIFLLNAGLDVLYVAAGAALWQLGKTPEVRGTGAGIVFQGGFLLAFDSAGALSARLWGGGLR